MWPTTFNFEDIKTFKYDDLKEILPYVTPEQHKLLNDYIIGDINFLLEECADEARKHKVTKKCQYNYYCHYPWTIDKKEDKLFYTAAIMSYLIYKGFEIVGKIFDEKYFFLTIEW